MFRWGIIFLVIALIAAALGFGGWPVPQHGQRKSCSWWVLFCSSSACLLAVKSYSDDPDRLTLA